MCNDNMYKVIMMKFVILWFILKINFSSSYYNFLNNCLLINIWNVFVLWLKRLVMVILCIYEVVGCFKDYRDVFEVFDCIFIFEREDRKFSFFCIERFI